MGSSEISRLDPFHTESEGNVFLMNHNGARSCATNNFRWNLDECAQGFPASATRDEENVVCLQFGVWGPPGQNALQIEINFLASIHRL